jgi:hypothetical protein
MDPSVGLTVGPSKFFIIMFMSDQLAAFGLISLPGLLVFVNVAKPLPYTNNGGGWWSYRKDAFGEG